MLLTSCEVVMTMWLWLQAYNLNGLKLERTIDGVHQTPYIFGDVLLSPGEKCTVCICTIFLLSMLL